MDALLADSPTVPGLLTEYILKGETECKAVSDIIMYLWLRHLEIPLVIGRGRKNIEILDLP